MQNRLNLGRIQGGKKVWGRHDTRSLALSGLWINDFARIDLAPIWRYDGSVPVDVPVLLFKGRKADFTFNFKPILESDQSSSGSSMSRKNPIVLSKMLLPSKGLLTFLAIFSMLAGFGTAEAGFFDALKSFFALDDGREQAAVFNAQNMPLLNAPNNIDPLAGIGGGDITIVQNNALLPVSGPLGSLADVEDNKKSDQISVYVVREGDNLSSIAKMFGVSVNTIVWANDLKRNDLISSGQTLVILPISGVRYEVEKGDTIQSVAKQFKGDADEIISFNGLPLDGKLTEGQIVIIPNGESYVVSSGIYSRNPYKGGGGPSYDRYYLRPISGGRKSQGLHGYNGVDLATYCGAPVFAAASGDVIIGRTFGWNGGYGLYTVVRHSNGTQTLYAHLGSVIVGAGWHVVQGQVLGYVGSTGNSTGCHLHFEVRGARNPL